MPRLRAKHRILLVAGALGMGWGAWWFARPSTSTASSGALAPLDAAVVGAWQPVARIPSESLPSARFTALDAVGDTLVLLQANRVTVVVDGRMTHGFGSREVGAPEFIARGAGIALSPQGIAVLDGARHIVTFWTHDGTRTHELPLESGHFGTQYAGLVAHGDTLFVNGFQVRTDDAAGWWVWRIVGDRTTPIIARHAEGEVGGGHDQPFMAVGAGGLLTLDARSWRLRRFDPSGALRDTALRADPPQFAVSDSARRRLRAITDRLPGPLQRSLRLEAFAPSLRGFTVAPDGRLLALTVVEDEALHVELLDAQAQAIARAWERPEDAPLFAVRGAIYRIRDDEHSYHIERLTLRPLPR